MNKNHLQGVSLLRVILNNEDITLSNVFVTGNAIAHWQSQKETVIDLAFWSWYKNSEGNGSLYIITDKK